ncbi:8341_t:CDS:2 [Paraglomus occultum]|uniref:8341_t:CDS:1 n=1 Tax=Paraglomus occultum TaxID=144539 RepID=A0A9N8WNY0_9GLOM|nr:8341_t:CDS:2 [Paraglomus occultum]
MPPEFDSSTGTYTGWFAPPTNIVFEDNQENRLSALVLNYALLGQTYDYTGYMWIEASIYYTEDSYDQSLELADSKFVNSLAMMSAHPLYEGQMYVARYSQSERYMLKENSLSAFGFPSGTIRVPYLTAELEGGPLPSSFTGYGRMAFQPQQFVVKIEIEQRSNTVLGAIGLLGGIWSIAARLYAFLLGRDTIRPWGCIQYYCCCFIRPTRSKLRKSFPVIPFQSSKASSESSSSFQSETTELRKKLDALELFIQDYIADTKYLDGLDKGEYPSRLSAWLSRFDLKKGGLNEASGGVNGNVINGISTQRMSEAPTQTVYYPTSSPIAPSSITEVYSGSSHSDSYYPQPDTYANQLLYTAPQFYTSDK